MTLGKEDGEPCFYLKIGDTKQDIEHTLAQGEHALCPQEPRKGYKTCNPVFWYDTLCNISLH
jgi:hypothetical protein